VERHQTDYPLAEGGSNQPILRSGDFLTLIHIPGHGIGVLLLVE